MTSSEAQLDALLRLENAVAEARNMAWIAAHIENDLRTEVSREKPGKYVIEVDEVASEALTWAIFETRDRVEALFEAFHKAASPEI